MNFIRCPRAYRRMLKSADHLKTLYRWWYNTIRSGFDSYDRTFHEPRIIYWIKYMKSSTFESVQRNEPNHVIIEFPERTSDCQEPKISHKKHIAILITREIRDWPCLKDLALSWWISAQFFDAGELCELRLHTVTCLASLYVGRGSEWGGGGGGVSKLRFWVKI